MRLVLLSVGVLLGACALPPGELDAGPGSDAGAPPPGGDAGRGDAAVAPEGPVTLSNLYDRLVDPARLAHMPRPFHHTYRSSSYDRRSIEPSAEGWFANEDWNHFVRVERRGGRTELVMADVAGPGAVVRIWSAAACRSTSHEEPQPA